MSVSKMWTYGKPILKHLILWQFNGGNLANLVTKQTLLQALIQ